MTISISYVIGDKTETKKKKNEADKAANCEVIGKFDLLGLT